MHPDRNELFAALSRDRFRAKFKLGPAERRYIADKSLPLVLEHGRGFLTKRLAPAVIANDGKQTPWRGHPTFVAQHATGTCCRSCLMKWHKIPKGRALTTEEIDYILDVHRAWIENQLTS